MAVCEEQKSKNLKQHLWMKDAARAAAAREKRKHRLSVSSQTLEIQDKIEGLQATKLPIIRMRRNKKIAKQKPDKNMIQSKMKLALSKDKALDINETRNRSKNKTKRKYVDKAVGRNETRDDVRKKESISKMAHSFNATIIPPIEEQSGIFEEVKDEHDIQNSHTNVGGRSQYKRRDSLHFYKEGYEPGHSVVRTHKDYSDIPETNTSTKLPLNRNIANNYNKNTNSTLVAAIRPNFVPELQFKLEESTTSIRCQPKRRNHGFHLSLNESTVSFLGASSMGCLEMSSGLVINQNRPNHGFKISLDDIDDYSKSAVFIKNKIFNNANEWKIEGTSPGRIEKQSIETAHVDVTVTAVSSNAEAINTNSLQPSESNILDISRGSTRLSFLYNKFTGFICKHCFQANCNHMKKLSPLTTPNKNVKRDISNLSHESEDKEKFPENSNDQDINMLFENLSERLNKNQQDTINLRDLKKLIKLKKVYREDENGNMVAYKEFVLDIYNATENIRTFLDETESELAYSDSNSEKFEQLQRLENDLDIDESLLRKTPIIPQNLQKISIIRKDDTDLDSIKSNRDVMCYDSDYDDASYLNACALSKSNTSFEKYDVTGDVFFTNINTENEIRPVDNPPGTPPLISSSPQSHQEEEQCRRGSNISVMNSSLKLSKRRSSLRSRSGLETVYESEVANYQTPNATLDYVDETLEHLLSFADEVLENSASSDKNNDNEYGEKQTFADVTEVDGEQLNCWSQQLEPENKERKEKFFNSNTENTVEYADLSQFDHLSDQSRENLNITGNVAGTANKLIYIKHVTDKNSYPGFDEEDKMQLWLQDVRKQTLNEEFYSSESENLLPEDEEVRHINTPMNELHSNGGNNRPPLNEREDGRRKLQTDEKNDSPEPSKTPSDVIPLYKHIDLLVLENTNDDNDSIDEASALHENTVRTEDSGVESRGTENSQASRPTLENHELAEADGIIVHQRAVAYSSEPRLKTLSSSERSHQNFLEPLQNYNSHLIGHFDDFQGLNNCFTPRPPLKPKPSTKAYKRNFSAGSLRKSSDTRQESYMNELSFVTMRNNYCYNQRTALYPEMLREPNHHYFSSSSLLPVNLTLDYPSVHTEGYSSERSYQSHKKRNKILPYFPHNTSLPLITDHGARCVSLHPSFTTRPVKYSNKKQVKKVLNKKHDTIQYLTLPYMRKPIYSRFSSTRTAIFDRRILPQHITNRYM